MFDIWLYTIVSVVVVSLVSLIGLITISISIRKLNNFLQFLISFAAGSLLGGAFLHLLPEAVEGNDDIIKTMAFILAGIMFFFALEKFLFWRHCHTPTSGDHPHPMAINNMIGDGFHNLIDGMIIAGSYLVSIPLGVATTLAVMLHEIPQEIGDFAILIHAGYSKKKALLFNFLSGLLAVVGAVITIAIGTSIEMVEAVLIPLTIGGFIYISTGDLIPELKSEEHGGRSALQFFAMLLGIGMMALLLLIE